MKQQNKILGFTLIELLVVITIIGILATGATSVYTSQIQKARDSTRISDIHILRGWIEQYYQDTSVYPSWSVDWLTNNGDVDMQDFVPNLAEDPKHNETCNGSQCWFIYTVWPDLVWIIDWAYEVSTAFENEGNRQSKAVSTSDNWDDDNRLEVWSLKSTNARTDLDTESTQGTSFDGSDAVALDATIVIVKWNVVKK